MGIQKPPNTNKNNLYLCVKHVLTNVGRFSFFGENQSIWIVTWCDVFPSSLIDSNMSLKWKQQKSKELMARSLVRNTLRLRGMLELWDEIRKIDKHLITHMDLHKTK
jgi:hypothetical protein